jgi:hypothetical protein
MFILSFLIILLFLNKSYNFLGKIEDSNRGPTAKDSYKASSFHTDVDISTKSEKIVEIAHLSMQSLTWFMHCLGSSQFVLEEKKSFIFT